MNRTRRRTAVPALTLLVVAGVGATSWSSLASSDTADPETDRLDPALHAALDAATADASAESIVLEVTSGWRSPDHQRRLLQDAVATYGSEAEAARWVATPETSPHVTGDAVDIGGAGAAEWLSHRGADYGLCQIYDNEPWHFELRPRAVTDGCPERYPDPTADPRMRE